MGFVIGTLTLHIRLEHSHSLKDKRQVLRSLKDRLKKRHNVAVAEVDHPDSWRDSVVVAAAVATSEAGARRVLDAVRNDALQILGRDLFDAGIDILEP